jgi:prepilin-type N-terminal cleavage/methylation domain-containing protein
VLRHKPCKAFSLLELVIVVVILGLIAAIAIPRLSRGTAGATDAALSGDLAALRNAIEVFAAEHSGNFPTLAGIEAQLTQYTDDSNTSEPVPKRDERHTFGPYLHAIPPLPVGVCRGKSKITGKTPPGTDLSAGWVYNQKTGQIRANCADTEIDSSDRKYSDYGGELTGSEDISPTGTTP